MSDGGMASLGEYVAKVRAENIPPFRIQARITGEAEARALLDERAGALTPEDIKRFAKAAGADESREGRSSSQRWGLGLSQPQINYWLKHLADINRVVGELWNTPEKDVYKIYARLRSERAPGGDMLASLVLYLRDPERFAVLVPSLWKGAVALGIVPDAGYGEYERFNGAVQAMRKTLGLDPRELDLILMHADPSRTAGADRTPSNPANAGIGELFDRVIEGYVEATQNEPFGKSAEMYGVFEDLRGALTRSDSVSQRPTLSVQASVGVGNWAHVPWIALLDSRAARSTQDGVYCVYLFRRDMSGFYLTLNQGVTIPRQERGWKAAREFLAARAADVRAFGQTLLQHGFSLDTDLDLRSDGLGSQYQASTIAHKFYTAGQLPEDDELLRDLDRALEVYSMYLGEPTKPLAHLAAPTTDRREAAERLVRAIDATGFVFEPWQLAAYVAAVRTKPFVILAGVSGTGKSQLPSLVAAATGSTSHRIPVRPDWTDSSEVLGYSDIAGQFRPGALLQVAKQAASEPMHQVVAILDEMNLARVEQYLAEVLSAIEDRHPCVNGGYESDPLLALTSSRDVPEWCDVGLGPNLAVVGTVNMDETTHGFSRKVIDRAFTLELSDVDLGNWNTVGTQIVEAEAWPASAWHPRATRIGEIGAITAEERVRVGEVVEVLIAANSHLGNAQLQLGYRTRDEIALFVLHASEIADSFVTRKGEDVDPLDLALHMKVLPRIAGGSAAVRSCIDGLLGWARGEDTDDPSTVMRDWIRGGRAATVPGSRFPRTAARLCLMRERLEGEGFTSYWV